MRIIERPRESAAFCANSRPIRAALSAATPVNCSCQAGCTAVDASS
jgi:hypothetical protein